MMKKLLVVMLVLGMSSIASATVVGLYIDPAAPGGSPGTALNVSETARVYVTVDTTGPSGSPLNLGSLDAIISIAGPGTIIGAINQGDLDPAAPGHPWGAYGFQVAPGPPPVYMHTGGWQQGLSFDPILAVTSAEIGMGQFGSQVYDTTLPPFAPQPPDMVTKFAPWYDGPVGYVDIHCDGPGLLTVFIVDGFSFGAFGSQMDDGVTKPGFGGSIGIYQVPEPATIALLGLGGLFLRRRRK